MYGKLVSVYFRLKIILHTFCLEYFTITVVQSMVLWLLNWTAFATQNFKHDLAEFSTIHTVQEKVDRETGICYTKAAEVMFF